MPQHSSGNDDLPLPNVENRRQVWVLKAVRCCMPFAALGAWWRSMPKVLIMKKCVRCLKSCWASACRPELYAVPCSHCGRTCQLREVQGWGGHGDMCLPQDHRDDYGDMWCSLHRWSWEDAERGFAELQARDQEWRGESFARGCAGMGESYELRTISGTKAFFHSMSRTRTQSLRVARRKRWQCVSCSCLRRGNTMRQQRTFVGRQHVVSTISRLEESLAAGSTAWLRGQFRPCAGVVRFGWAVRSDPGRQWVAVPSGSWPTDGTSEGQNGRSGYRGLPEWMYRQSGSQGKKEFWWVRFPHVALTPCHSGVSACCRGNYMGSSPHAVVLWVGIWTSH